MYQLVIIIHEKKLRSFIMKNLEKRYLVQKINHLLSIACYSVVLNGFGIQDNLSLSQIMLASLQNCQLTSD